MSRLVIVGTGGHGAVVAEAADASNQWDEIVFVDDSPTPRSVVGLPVVGNLDQLEQLIADDTRAIVAVGDNRTRLALCEDVESRGLKLATVIHPSACVSPSSQISEAGSIVCAGAIINTRASLGRACIANTGATVDHDCRIADGVHISPGANLAGTVSVGECTWIGIGAAVRQGTRIGNDVIVGAGSAVVSDIADGLTVGGVPAKRIDSQ